MIEEESYEVVVEGICDDIFPESSLEEAKYYYRYPQKMNGFKPTKVSLYKIKKTLVGDNVYRVSERELVKSRDIK